MKKIAVLSLVLFAANLGAAPSVYPTGVTRYDTATAYNSYVIFSGQDKKTHLIDMNGNEVHSWKAEGFPPVLLDPALTGGKRGNVLLQLASTLGSFNQGDGLNNQAIGELDWNSNVVWQWGAAGSAQDAYAAPVEGKADAQVPGGSAKQHHDWRRLKNGNTLVLANLVHPVKGFSAPQVLDDVIYEVNQRGDIAVPYDWVPEGTPRSEKAVIPPEPGKFRIATQ